MSKRWKEKSNTKRCNKVRNYINYQQVNKLAAVGCSRPPSNTETSGGMNGPSVDNVELSDRKFQPFHPSEGRSEGQTDGAYAAVRMRKVSNLFGHDWMQWNQFLWQIYRHRRNREQTKPRSKGSAAAHGGRSEDILLAPVQFKSEITHIETPIEDFRFVSDLKIIVHFYCCFEERNFP